MPLIRYGRVLVVGLGMVRALFLLIIVLSLPLSAFAASPLQRCQQVYAKPDARVTYEQCHPLAVQGVGEASFILSNLYTRGIGTSEPDLHQALIWLIRAAEQGYGPACYNLAALYERGEVVDQNFPLAYTWYEKGAAQGHTESQLKVGIMSLKGIGAEANYQKAQAWLGKAAASGNQNAQVTLAILLRGSAPEQSLSWFQQAADQGNPYAYYQLADVYTFGKLNQPMDLEKALQLAKQSVYLGRASSKELVTTIEGRLQRRQETADESSSSVMAVTETPATEIPATENPVTENPVTENPATEIQVTENSATENSATSVAVFQPVAVDAPAIQALAVAQSDAVALRPHAVAAAMSETTVSETTLPESMAPELTGAKTSVATLDTVERVLASAQPAGAEVTVPVEVASAEPAPEPAPGSEVALVMQASEAVAGEMAEVTSETSEDSAALSPDINTDNGSEKDNANVAVAPRADAVDSSADAAERPLKDKAWLMAQPSKHYVLQLAQLSSEAAVETFLAKTGLQGKANYYHAVTKAGKVYVVLYGESYAGFSVAKKAGNTQLPSALRDTVWYRRYQALQDSYRSPAAP